MWRFCGLWERVSDDPSVLYVRLWPDIYKACPVLSFTDRARNLDVGTLTVFY